MPLSPEEFYAHAMMVADAEGRMPLSRMTGWDIFPFEAEGLRVVPLQSPSLPEAPRQGEDGTACRSCADQGESEVWADDNWRLNRYREATGVPLILMLLPKSHHDLIDLPDELASEFGRLIVHVARAIESLPHVARAHVSRYGDGGAHLHIFFIARPEGFAQLRGTCLALWDDLLPQGPLDMRDADADSVARALANSYGGNVITH